MSKRVWTAAEVRGLGLVTNVETAASILGIGRTTAYALVRAGSFPAQVLRVGSRYVVSTEGVLAALGITAAGPAEAEERQDAAGSAGRGRGGPQEVYR